MAVVKNLIVRAGADFSELEQKMASAGKKMSKWGKGIQKIGSSLTSNVTVPAVAAVAGLGAIAVSAGQAADELITLSNQTGVSTKTLQELSYASRFVDVEVETMTKGMGKVVKAMGAANKSGSDYIKLSGGLKVAIKGSNGEMLKTEEVFYSAIDALGQMSNETEREIASQELFGKSYQDLMPLIKAGSGELKKYADEAANLGVVMSDADVNALGKFDDSMQQLQATMEGAKNKLAVALIPAIEAMTPIIRDTVVPLLVDFATWLSNVTKKFSEMPEGTQKAILQFGAVVVAAGPVLSIFGSLLTTTGGLMGSMAKLSGAIGTVGTTSTAAAGGVGTLKAGFLGLSATTAGILALGAAWAGLLYWIAKVEEKWDKARLLADQAAGIKEGLDYASTSSARDRINGTGTGVNTSRDAALKQSQTDKKNTLKENIRGFATGTNYVPQDMLALIHKGEAIVPKEYNEPRSAATVTNLYLDGRQIATATGKVQYTKNHARARTMGVVTT